MTILTKQSEEGSGRVQVYQEPAEIGRRLNKIGVVFERWEVGSSLAPDADQAAVLAAYRTSIDGLNERYGFQSVDVIHISPDHPERESLRQKFLAEHVHADFEIRLFVAGRGLFYLHIAHEVYGLLCTPGDLISVPAHTPHWFDLGPEPELVAIRFFTTPDGWVAEFTGNSIADRFPKLPEFISAFSGEESTAIAGLDP